MPISIRQLAYDFLQPIRAKTGWQIPLPATPHDDRTVARVTPEELHRAHLAQLRRQRTVRICLFFAVISAVASAIGAAVALGVMVRWTTKPVGPVIAPDTSPTNLAVDAGRRTKRLAPASPTR